MKRFLTYTLLLLLTYNHAKAEEPAWEQLGEYKYLNTIANTDWGIAVGEFSSNTQPYNGVIISNNLGKTWDKAGLESRGITSLRYYNDTLYASTYYHVNGTNGLFYSKDKGAQWQHVGNNVSTTVVDRDNKTIYLGTYNHGLWISFDEGNTWVQKIGTGWFGPKINFIKSVDSRTLVSYNNSTIITSDNGNTWNTVSELAGKTIISALINEDFLLAGTLSPDGLYYSSNGGINWQKSSFLENHSISGITSYKEFVYIAATKDGIHNVYETNQNLDSPKNLNLNINNGAASIKGLVHTRAYPNYLFINLLNHGQYKLPIIISNTQSTFTLDPPWSLSEGNSIVNYISSFFDHEFPLFGYDYYPEPLNTTTTTLNFLGQREEQPYLYYSSHHGIDFSIPYGTEVKAAESGYASYYFCQSCGHTIQIDHTNGYATTYMHLQDNALITTSTPTFVEKGEVLGKVGMTGNTTGPHLHFALNMDLDQDGNFLNDEPDGRVDPFGWMSNSIDDPWAGHKWIDVTGQHSGTKSVYMWALPIDRKEVFIGGGDTQEVSLKDKVITFISDLGASPFTAEVSEGPKPKVHTTQMSLKHASSTSLIVDIVSPTGKDLGQIDGTMKMKFDLDDEDLKNISLDSIKVYFWNKLKKLWEPIASKFNKETKTVEAETDHFSHFAVFGEKIDIYPPETTIKTTGTKYAGWYLDYPVISFEHSDKDGSQIYKTFYSIDKGITWDEYTEPVTLSTDGVLEIHYRSEDIEGNLEDTKISIVKVNTKDNWTNKTKVVNTSFTTK